MKPVFTDLLSLLPSLSTYIFRTNSFDPLIKILTTVGHVPLKFAIIAVLQLIFFHVMRSFPSIRSNRKRVSWILTWGSTTIMGICSIITYLSLVRTVFHAPVSYELYNRVDPATGMFYRRTDIPFRPSRSYPGIPVVASPPWREQNGYSTEFCLDQAMAPLASTTGKNTTNQCQCIQEQYDRDMWEFYHQIDSTFYAPASSPKAVYPSNSFADLFGRLQLPPRILFDLTFIPGRNALTEWVTLLFASYLTMDIVVGLIYYPEQITFMSGYFHHALHLLMCAIAFHCNTIDNLVIFLLVEVPTSILALGFMFPRFRNDKLFGVLFFVIRIVIDVLMSHEMLRNTSMGNAPKIMTAFKVPLNFKLFADFIGQQKRLRRRQRQQQKEAGKKKEKNSVQPLASIE
ncbi:hypothetical protein BGZ93_008538 [Podila epicladia]|nr:hypothetical protein BGZ92_001752 [Podila epicladia]KAG0092012.1 hypothetical protein BGZ93_008538 [Podila epicladia]